MPGPIRDGYGIEFLPDFHFAYIKAALDAHRREQEERVKNPPPPVEVPVRERPAGWYPREVKDRE